MPTYAYACTECEHKFEQAQAFSEDALTSCPQCQGRLRKLFNAVGVVFKGSGFYKTDSRSSKEGGSAGPPAAKGDAKSESSSKSEPSSKSESSSKSTTESSPSAPSKPAGGAAAAKSS